MGRTPCCEKVGLKKGPWTPEEDHKLLAFIDAHGHGSWRALPSKAGLRRCGKSCRLRWTNYLRPDIKRGKFSAQEERTIIQLHALLGNRWSAIASQLPKRTDNEIKNYWNTSIRKRLTKMGIDPITHKRITTAAPGSGQASKNTVANLSHMAQWENARLQAESRLVRKAKLVANPNQIIQQNSSARLVCRPSSTLEPLMRPRPHCLDVLKAWQGIMLDKALHGDYYSYTLESPTSTLNFSEVGSLGTFLPNQSMAPPANYADYNLSTGYNNINDQGMVMIVKQNHDQLEILEPNKMENPIELHNDDMISSYPINCTTMEGLMDDLVDHNGSGANGHNLITENSAGGDFEENSWNNLLNNLANFSLPSASPIFDLTPP